MSEAGSFLLPQDEKQPELLPMAPSFFTALESRGEFTGERLFKERPDTYKAVVVLLAQKMGVIRIAQALGVSSNTVMAVRDREGAAIDVVKDHIARVAHAGATIAGEAMLQRLNDIASDPVKMRCLGVKELKDLAVTFGILVQNGQLLAGQPTSRIEIAEVKPEHDSFNEYLASLQTINPLEQGDAGTKGGNGRADDREPSKSGPNRAGAAGPGALIDLEPSGDQGGTAGTAGTDLKSDV